MKSVLMAAIIACAGVSNAAGCDWQQDDPNDRIGATRTQTPEKALAAIGLVRTGEVFRLGHDLDAEPLGEPPFRRVFELEMNAFSFPDAEDNSQAFQVGKLTASLGQLFTQFDALAHAGHDLGYYNCVTPDSLGPNEYGQLTELGVENARPFVTRAVLLDFVAHSAVPKVAFGDDQIVADSYVITVADIESVLANQEVAPPGKGDVVLVYTGWDGLFGVDNARHFNSPGIGIEAARWLAERGIAMLGSDTQHSEAAIEGRSVELSEDPEALGPGLGFMFNAVHFVLITQNGIHLLEWMKLGELAEAMAREGPHEGLFVYSPLPVKGMAGAPASPLFIR